MGLPFGKLPYFHDNSLDCGSEEMVITIISDSL